MQTRSSVQATVTIALLSLVASCGSADDEADTLQEPELTNVEPREAVPPVETPDVDELSTDKPQREHAIDPRDPEDTRISPTEVNRYAEVEIAGASGSSVTGNLRFHEEGDTMHITGEIRGLEPGEHGFHIHVTGDCSAADFASAQGHFAPDDDPHGSPQEPDDSHHVGDLGNIVANEDGIAQIDKSDNEMTLGTGENTIIDRAVIVHAERDNLLSQPSGDAGPRVGCGVVELKVDAAY